MNLTKRSIGRISGFWEKYGLRAVQSCEVPGFYLYLFLCIFLFTISQGGADEGNSYVGLTYRQQRNSFDLLSIHILEVSPEKYKIVAARALDSGLGRETVQSIAERHGAIAAVNGGYFEIDGNYDGLPKGILKIGEKWYATPYKLRGAIGWKEDGRSVLVDRLEAECWASLSGQKIFVEGINRPMVFPMIYTNAFHVTTLTPFEASEWVIKQGNVHSISKHGSSPIPAGGWVLSTLPKSHEITSGNQDERLAYYRINLLPSFQKDADWNSLDYIVGGVPVLIHKGRRISDFSPEKAKETFITGSHARTAVGILPNGNWVFVVVDGNLPNESLGMTIEQLAVFMENLGCVEALNLDGGGSSTLYFEDKIVNHPTGDEDEDSSELKQRRVSDAILIMPG